MIIGAFLALMGIVMASGGSWGAAGVTWVIALFIIICWSTEKTDAKVWYHHREYWSKSGKDRAKLRHQWEREARAEEERERQAAMERERRKRDREADKELKRIRKEYEKNPPPLREQKSFESEVLKARSGPVHDDHVVARLVREKQQCEAVGSSTEMGKLFKTNNPATWMNGPPIWMFTCRSCMRQVRMTVADPFHQVMVSCPFCGKENKVRFTA